MKHRTTLTLFLCSLTLLALALPARADYKKGGTAYTKRLETPLLAEPSPLAASVAKIDFAQALKIDEVRGAWLRVSIKKPKATGWVYSGNVADDEPVIPPTTGMTTDTASATGAAAAARPLTKISQEYAQSHDTPTVETDWLSEFAATVTDQHVTAYVIENKKGEYQQ